MNTVKYEVLKQFRLWKMRKYQHIILQPMLIFVQKITYYNKYIYYINV